MANRLKELREAQGLSLVALAKRVGTSSQQVSHLELGKRHLTVEWLTRVSAALGCHPWSIVSEDLPPATTPAEQRLLETFRSLSPAEQQTLVARLRGKLQRNNGNTDGSSARVEPRAK